ncbi:HXXEE domain-containing protein [Bacillus sp. FJAT-29790]|uniref:HXXEE domain-containing protein n=1 Tax=Bacillus sp. FJAT-29790 TaxID=1895002 RepID=UPI001C224B44|nr:HXXEE domain-containing protein [Bacillus sp. FJAT-29790]MBU8878517.1 HXXEE domain-containing protein [Bacillus sp. FJAT-29790]
MLEGSHNLFDIVTVIWLFPIVFMFHDLEELITIEHFSKSNKIKDQKPMPAVFALFALIVKRKFSTKTVQFAVAVTWIFLILSFITLFTVQSLPNGGSFLLFIAAINIFFLQVFTHIGQTIIYRGYTPGVITALFIVIPYCLYTYYRLLESDLIDWQFIFDSIPISLFIVPVLLIGNILGRLINP